MADTRITRVFPFGEYPLPCWQSLRILVSSPQVQIFRALLWGGTPFKLLELATDGKLSLYTSPALIAELRDVLHRDHLARWLANQHTAIEDAIRLYEDLCMVVSPLSTPRAAPNDIDDDQVIACVPAAGAQLIASGDSDLLVLHPWKSIHILNAAEAVQFVKNAKTEQ